MSVIVDVQDSSLPNWLSDTHVYLPKLHKFAHPFSIEDISIEHSDVIETWKGLTLAQARELRFWQDAFKAAIDSLVEEALIESFTKAGIELDLDRSSYF